MTKLLHPSVEEPSARGEAARTLIPPSGHAGWTPAVDRPDPVALLEVHATPEPDLVPSAAGA